MTFNLVKTEAALEKVGIQYCQFNIPLRTIPEIFLEGLTHDVLILNKLLKRHRCSHGRTIYFRRMNMTLKCLLQTQRMIMVENVHRLKELQKNINQYHQELNRKKKKQKRQPREEEEEWNLQQLKPTLTAGNNKTTAKVSVSQLTVLIEEFQKLIFSNFRILTISNFNNHRCR